MPAAPSSRPPRFASGTSSPATPNQAACSMPQYTMQPTPMQPTPCMQHAVLRHNLLAMHRAARIIAGHAPRDTRSPSPVPHLGTCGDGVYLDCGDIRARRHPLEKPLGDIVVILIAAGGCNGQQHGITVLQHVVLRCNMLTCSRSRISSPSSSRRNWPRHRTPHAYALSHKHAHAGAHAPLPSTWTRLSSRIHSAVHGRFSSSRSCCCFSNRATCSRTSHSVPIRSAHRSARRSAAVVASHRIAMPACLASAPYDIQHDATRNRRHATLTLGLGRSDAVPLRRPRLPSHSMS